MNVRKTLTFQQLNTGNIQEVFPLLCPVREVDWLDGWHYNMIHSTSGLIEQDCVFSTPHHGKSETVWYVSQYDPTNHKIEFVRITTNESVVKINIELKAIDQTTTEAQSTYQYTGLSDAQNRIIETNLEGEFTQSMKWWEKAINHYLKTSEKLVKSSL